MRAAMVTGIVVLVLAAVAAPLPLHVAQPARLVAADDVVDVTISEQFLADAGTRPGPVSGAYLGVAQVAGAPLVEVVRAGLDSTREVVREPGEQPQPLDRPGVVAAVIGLGLSPARVDRDAVPVTARVGDGLSARSVGAMLHIFDTTSALDLARGRRILGVGSMRPDQTLACPAPAGASVAAAQEADVDIVVVPAECGAVDASAPVVVAGSLLEAIDALSSP